MRLLRLVAVIVVAATALTFSQPIFSQQVSTDYDHTTDFAQFHTYSFGNVRASNPLFEQRMRDQISRDLDKRGWRMVPSGGDVTISAIGGMQNQQEYSTFYDGMGGGGFGWRRGWGGGGFGDSYTTVNQIPVGTLVLDLYQTGSHRLLFRGTASDQLSNNAEKNTSKLDKAIDKIFDKFPLKTAA